MPKIQINRATIYPFPNGIVSVSGLKPGTLNQSMQTNKMSPATLKAGRRAASTSRKHKSFRCCNIGVFFLLLLGGQGVSARVQPQCGFTDIPLQKFETSVGAEKFTVMVLDKAVEKSVEVFGKSAIEKASQTMVQETAKVCTRSSQCTQKFVEIGTQYTVRQATKKGLQEVATKTVEASWKETAKKIGEYAGPAISAGVTAYEVVGDLKEGNTANAVVSTTTGVASYYASLQAGGYCASSTIYLGPVVSGGAAFLCSVGTAIGVQMVGNELKTNSVSVSSSSQDNGKTDTGSESSTKVIPDISTATDTNEETKVGTKRKREEEKDCYERVFEAHPNDRRFQRAHGEYLRLKATGQSVAHGMLRFIVHEYPRPKNSLMPSENSNIVFTQLRHCIGFPFQSNSALFRFLQADGGNALFGNRNDLRRDQRIRASAIVDHMITTGQRILRTMDGAGRFVYSFLEELFRRNLDLDEWTIELFDIDPQVHLWHTLFMPASNINHLQDILTHPKEEGFHRGTLVYFNFCGLADLVTTVRQTLGSFYENDHETFISWSVRGVNGERLTRAYEFAKWIAEPRGIRISRRKHFYTFKLRKMSVYQRELSEEEEVKKEENQKYIERKNLKRRERSKRNRVSKARSIHRSGLARLHEERQKQGYD